MSSPTPKKRVRITDAFEQRVEMVDGRFDLPNKTLDAMNQIRGAAAAFARVLQQVHSDLGKDNVNYGRLIAAVDLIQNAKNVACDAVILPHAIKDEK